MKQQLTDRQINNELDDFWRQSQSLWQQWQYQADIDTKMLSGQQSYLSTPGTYQNGNRLMFNKILRVHNMIGGFQRDNRLASIVVPGENDPDGGQSADDLSKVLSWAFKQDSTYERISDCFDGSNACGLNLMHVYMDFREDPENGEIRTTRLPFSSFIMDPYFTRQDLSDCERIWTRVYLGKKDLTNLIPDIESKIGGFSKGYTNNDGKFPFLPQNWYQYQMEIYAYDEYWTKTYRTAKKILDKSTGEVVDWHGDEDQLKMLAKINPNITLIKAKVPTIRRTVLVNNQVVDEEDSIWGLDRFPFAASICYHYPEVQDYSYRYQGISRNLRSIQIELDARINKLLDVLDAQVQSGIIVKEDALVNPEDAFFQGPGRVLFLKNTANLQTDITQIPPPPVAPGWMELVQMIEKEIMDIVGPEELFAQNLGNKEMSGVLMKLKMGAGLIGLRNIFDRVNVFQMNVTEIFGDLILNNFSSGKITQIIGKAPSPLIAEATAPEHQLKGISKNLLKYNCVIEEAELTSTQRQMQFLQAIQLKQLGVPIPTKYLIEKSTIQGKKELIEFITKEEEQQSQLQQAQNMAEMQQTQMLAQSLASKGEADKALAQERKARVLMDIAAAKERTSEAVHDRAKAALDNARALQAMDQIDEERVMNLSRHLHEIQQVQAQQMMQEEEENMMEAAEIAMPDEEMQQYDEEVNPYER